MTKHSSKNAICRSKVYCPICGSHNGRKATHHKNSELVLKRNDMLVLIEGSPKKNNYTGKMTLGHIPFACPDCFFVSTDPKIVYKGMVAYHPELRKIEKDKTPERTAQIRHFFQMHYTPKRVADLDIYARMMEYEIFQKEPPAELRIPISQDLLTFISTGEITGFIKRLEEIKPNARAVMTQVLLDAPRNDDLAHFLFSLDRFFLQRALYFEILRAKVFCAGFQGEISDTNLEAVANMSPDFADERISHEINGFDRKIAGYRFFNIAFNYIQSAELSEEFNNYYLTKALDYIRLSDTYDVIPSVSYEDAGSLKNTYLRGKLAFKLGYFDETRKAIDEIREALAKKKLPESHAYFQELCETFIKTSIPEQHQPRNEEKHISRFFRVDDLKKHKK